MNYWIRLKQDTIYLQVVKDHYFAEDEFQMGYNGPGLTIRDVEAYSDIIKMPFQQFLERSEIEIADNRNGIDGFERFYTIDAATRFELDDERCCATWDLEYVEKYDDIEDAWNQVAPPL